MSDFRTAHAIPIMLCVGMMILALCMVAYATLAPDSSIRVFLFAFAFVLFVVSFNKMLSVAWYEKNLSRLHDELSHVSPDTCPDYWQAGFDKCHGHKCKPYFRGQSAEGEEGTVWMMGNAEEDAEIRLRDYQAMSADSLCNLNRQYPWMELSNECAAHNRTL
jgi:hypothetical protein